MTIKLTPELEEKILIQLENGTGLRKICAQKGMPSRSTVLRWQDNNKDFEAKCARAMQHGSHVYADNQIDITEGVLSGAITPEAARVVISAYQWRAAKLYPKKYGDKQQVEHSGGMTLEQLVLGSMQKPDKSEEK